MVYSGKPSKACLHCRRRKLRCDLRRDTCSQCVRASLECSGYRDPEQLRIRDESQKTKLKALSRTSKTIPPTLIIPIGDRARNAFFLHFVSGFSNTYDVLGTLYEKPQLDTVLVTSVDTVSLAFFSLQSHDTQTQRLARERYLDALPLLNKALTSPESATTDSTLLAVLLLDLFEKMTSNSSGSTDSWMSHVNGALALVRMRDKNQWRNHTGLKLSVRLSINFLISCVAANAPVPPALTKLRSDLEPYLNKDDPKWQVSGLVVKYTNLKGAIQDDVLTKSEIITRTVELDREFLSIANNMPSDWLYSTTYLEEASERVFSQYFDTYANHFTTQTWNVLRIMRIFLNDILRAQCSEVSTGNLEQPSTSDTIDDIANEICATAPQYMSSDPPTPKSKDFSETQKLRCYTLLFPLYVAGLYASNTTGIKPWIIKQLRFISDEMGIRNAGIVADILDSGDGTSPWDVYAILGSYAFAA